MKQRRRIRKPPLDTATLRRLIEVPQVRTLWGCQSTVTPGVVERILGDGLKLLCMTFFFGDYARPNYLVIRIDSRWDVDNDIPDHLDDIYEAIDEEYCNEPDEGEVDTGETEWSSVCDGGSMWGEMEWPAGARQALAKAMTGTGSAGEGGGEG